MWVIFVKLAVSLVETTPVSLPFLSQLADLPPWQWLMLFSVPFIASILFVPWAVVRIPDDYFHHAKRHRVPWGEYHPVLRLLMLVAKNLLGLMLVLAGIAMLVLPGQGLLTMLIGLLFVDFPGKYRCERWLVTRKPVLQAINWLRHKHHKPPLRF